MFGYQLSVPWVLVVHFQWVAVSGCANALLKRVYLRPGYVSNRETVTDRVSLLFVHSRFPCHVTPSSSGRAQDVFAIVNVFRSYLRWRWRPPRFITFNWPYLVPIYRGVGWNQRIEFGSGMLGNRPVNIVVQEGIVSLSPLEGPINRAGTGDIFGRKRVTVCFAIPLADNRLGMVDIRNIKRILNVLPWCGRFDEGTGQVIVRCNWVGVPARLELKHLGRRPVDVRGAQLVVRLLHFEMQCTR